MVYFYDKKNASWQNPPLNLLFHNFLHFLWNFNETSPFLWNHVSLFPGFIILFHCFLRKNTSFWPVFGKKWSFNFGMVIRQNFRPKTFIVRMDEWMDGWTVIKSVLQFSLFWCMLKIMYLCTYIWTQKLSPRFLWVSKFDVKLRVIDKNFKITVGRWIFFFWV